MAIKITSSVDANRLMGVIKKAVRKWAHKRFGDEFAEEFVNDYVAFETWHHENGYLIFEVRGEWDYDDAYSLIHDYLNPAVEFFFGSNRYYFEPYTTNVLWLAIPDEKIGGKQSAVGRSATRRNAYLFEDDVDETLSVMDCARDAWAGPGWYRTSESTTWCDSVSDLELCISSAYRVLDSYDDLVVEYLGGGEEPTLGACLAVGSHDRSSVKKEALMRKRASFNMDKIVDEVYKAASDWIRSHFGEEEADYLYVEATDSNTIEVRDELSYDENDMLINDALNPIVQSYDPTSYFDFYAATVLQAVLWDEEARKETWYVKHDVNAIDGEYDLVWDGDLDAHPYVVKEFDGAWHVGVLGFDDKIYFGDPIPAPEYTFGSWDEAMKSIPSSDIYEFVRVGSRDRNDIKKEALMRKRKSMMSNNQKAFCHKKKSASFADVYIGDGESLDGTKCEFWAKIDVDGVWGWEAVSEYDDTVVDDCYGFETAEEAAHDCKMTHSMEASRKNASSPMVGGKKKAADGRIDIYRANYDDFMRLKSGSAWTWEGMNTDWGNLSAIVNWFDEQGCPLVKNEFWYILGSDMNSWCRLTGDNAYPDDLTILCIELDNITNCMALIYKKFEVEARWLDDIVDNNERREREKRRDGSANRLEKGSMNNRFAKRNSRNMRRKSGNMTHNGGQFGWIGDGFRYSITRDDLRVMMFECMYGEHESVTHPDDISEDDIGECIEYLQIEVDNQVGDMIQDFCDENWDRWEDEDDEDE